MHQSSNRRRSAVAVDDVAAVASKLQLALDRVHHLLGWRNPGRGDENQKRHLVRCRRSERPIQPP